MTEQEKKEQMKRADYEANVLRKEIEYEQWEAEQDD